MGFKERRNVEIKEMKKKIMDAAIEIIEQEGYEKLSIRKIATKIEYSPTTIYLYYKDKAEIISDMSNELYGKVVGEIVAIVDETTVSLDKQVHDIMCAFIKGLCGEQEMTKAIMYSGVNVIFTNSSINGKPENAGIDMLDKIIAAGIEDGIFRSCAKDTSWMIISAMLGFILSVIENKLYTLCNFTERVDAFVEILMGGIRQ